MWLTKLNEIEQKGISWAGLAGRCLTSQWYSLLINIHLFSIFTYTWFGTKSLSHYWLIHDLGLSFLAMLMTLRESILWVGFKLTNKLHNFHYYYNILKSLQPCVSGWWGWKKGSEMRILAAKFNAKMRTDTSFLKLITTLPLLRVFKETWQGSRTLRYRGCIEKKDALNVHMYMAKSMVNIFEKRNISFTTAYSVKSSIFRLISDQLLS